MGKKYPVFMVSELTMENRNSLRKRLRNCSPLEKYYDVLDTAISNAGAIKYTRVQIRHDGIYINTSSGTKFRKSWLRLL